jgi:hypothetical protein
MCFGGGGGDGGAAQARADEQARQDRIKQGVSNVDKSFAKFDDNYYNQRGQAYQNYAMPQFNNQYKQMGNNLAFSLARSGNTDSSEAARQGGILQSDNAFGRQQIADQAIGEQQKARQQVEENRNSLINQLQATSNPSLAAAGAERQAAALAMQPAFSPLGNLFNNTTAVLGNAYQAGAYGGGPGLTPYKQYFGFGSPSPKGNTVVR